MDQSNPCTSILSLSSTLAWLYQYDQATPLELSSLFPGYTLPKLDEPITYNQCVLMTRRDVLSSTINKIVRQLVYFLVITVLGRSREKYDQVVSIVQEAIDKEIYYRTKGYVVFFHAQKSGFYILDQASYRSNNHPFTPACKKSSSNYPLAPDRALYELQMNINSDQDPSYGARLISVNYSIFGNFSFDDLGESSQSFLINNTSLFIKPANLVSLIDVPDQSKHILEQMLIEEQDRRYKDRLPGRLLLIAIPCDKIDEFVYNSRQVGSLYRVKTPKVSQFLSSTYLSPQKQSFNEINLAQARILDLCFTEYGKKQGIIIESFDAIPNDEKVMINQQLAMLFQN